MIRELIAESKKITFDLEHAERLADGFNFLDNSGINVILLDLNLPDSQGLETLKKVVERNSSMPVIVLTGINDEQFGIKALQGGAQDYLIKGQVGIHLLTRSIQYAIGRQQFLEHLRTVSLLADLTGLYNRRGLYALAQSHLLLAKRAMRDIALFYLDLDLLKFFNDRFDHAEGDNALIELSNILRGTFRRSDIIARIGGDEFAVLAIEICDLGVLRERLKKNVNGANLREDRKYDISVSIGIVCCQPELEYSIDKLIKKADKLMYDEKKKKMMLKN